MIDLERIAAHCRELLRDPGHVHYLRWVAARGDHRHRLEYDLDSKSVVFDVGGFKGDWSREISGRYGARLHIFEPISSFRSEIADRLKSRPNVVINGFGLGGEGRRAAMAVHGDCSTLYGDSSDSESVRIRDIVSYIQEHDLQEIHLLKLNVEGAEFEILERLLDTGYIKIVANLQVQFHKSFDDARERRREIVRRLRATHRRKWNYPFVWEGWSRKG